ncbi:hypothetical protein Tco_1226952 [Tanacetum coccineum]
MMEDFTERMNQQREQEALLAAQREQELLAQKQVAQEEQVPSSNSVFHQLIEETCGMNVCEEQKKNMEDTMLDLLEICRQKEILCIHDNVDDLIGSALNSKLLLIKLNSQHLDKEKQEIKNIVEQAPKRRTRIASCLQNFKVITKERIIPSNKMPQISLVNAFTPDLPTEEPEYSLNMGDEHLSTILEKELDEFIKSSVENLVPIPCESEVTSNNESECDMPVGDESSLTFTTFSNPLFDSNDDFTFSDDKSFSDKDVPRENFKIYSNPRFDDEEIISFKIDPHYFNAESDLIEYLLNRDTLINSSPKFDYLLEKFSSELAHTDPIPPVIVDTDLEPKEEISLAENLLYDNSSPRPPEERNCKIADTIVESLSPSRIPVEDSDSLMEEIDLFLASDDSMPPGIEIDDYDSEGDIRFLEELLSNNSPPLPENESSNLDHFNDPSSPRPPPKPPDVEICFDIKPDAGILTTKMVKGISEHDVLMPNVLPTLPTFDPYLNFTSSHDSLGSGNKIFDPGIFFEVQSKRLLSRDGFSFSFIRDPLYPVFDLLLPFSSENKDKVFKPGILSFPFSSHRDKIISDFSKSPMMMYGGDIPHLDVPFLHFYPP